MIRNKEMPSRRTAILQEGPTMKQINDSSIPYHHSVKTRIEAEGKVIGYLEDHTFIKTVIGSKHRLRRPPAWAIDAEAFDREVKPNATKIVVRDRETGLEYHCLVEAFDRLKRALDRGFGRQYFLTLNHWEVRGNGHHQLALWGGDNNA